MKVAARVEQSWLLGADQWRAPDKRGIGNTLNTCVFALPNLCSAGAHVDTLLLHESHPLVFMTKLLLRNCLMIDDSLE